MAETFSGGLARPGKMIGVLGPWIVLTPSASHLDFEMGSNWMRRFFGPWQLEHAGVREVYMGAKVQTDCGVPNSTILSSRPFTDVIPEPVHCGDSEPRTFRGPEKAR
ncbi:hypothetical protein J2S90_002552 [Arthrobacter bambusae]|uniref:Uncharacterized protein n=1 Tax=Arthrobacter bambusae TaxID=1338426 RepID=A0AAW8DIT8_9MICC|nr:hypothetical protein [Arthrobacter bambusae]MDQ0127337.1 hypothetical protein [Arthrobacter bambusae]MDQ0178679.1 hypothetical protein [Arthrobacter bambusae]